MVRVRDRCRVANRFAHTLATFFLRHFLLLLERTAFPLAGVPRPLPSLRTEHFARQTQRNASRLHVCRPCSSVSRRSPFVAKSRPIAYHVRQLRKINVIVKMFPLFFNHFLPVSLFPSIFNDFPFIKNFDSPIVPRRSAIPVT